jgi:hypothetical protein
LIGYDSEEALRAAPQENVVNTLDSILVQHVVYDEIKNEPDPAIRSAAEEAKRQELEARPGVNYVEYNCSATAEAQQFAPPPADCGECGANIGRAAAQIIGGSEDADGKTAYEVALEAARSVDEGNVALAAENGEEDMGVAGTGEEDVDAAGTGEEDTGDAEATETEEETTAGGNTSKDTGEETVNGAVASGESRVNSPLLALGGGVLLVAGVFMARFRAAVTAAVRSVTPSLSKMWSMWLLTVVSLTQSCLAISLLLVPRATSSRTSISLALKTSSAGSRILRISRAATAGDRGDLPSAAARIAAKSSSRGASFKRKPVAPTSTAQRMSASLS